MIPAKNVTTILPSTAQENIMSASAKIVDSKQESTYVKSAKHTHQTQTCAFCGEIYKYSQRDLSKKTLDFCFNATMMERMKVLEYVNQSLAQDNELLDHVMKTIFVTRRTHSFRVMIRTMQMPVVRRLIRGNRWLMDGIAHFRRHRSWSVWVKLETDPARRKIPYCLLNRFFHNGLRTITLSPFVCANRIYLGRMYQLLSETLCPDTAYITVLYLHM